MGAGIQIGPNMSRILRRWGILDHLLSEAVPLKTISVRRYADNSELAHISMADVEETYEGPILVTHRADLQRVLKVAAEDAGVHIETGAFVEDIDFANARIKIKDRQEWLKSDLIIAADGLKSTIRKKMLALHGQIDQARETGDAAWRVIIPSEKIYGTGDMSLIEALEKPAGFRWIGPDAHIMGYPIRNHQLFNLVLLHPDNVRTQESWTVKGDKKEMLQFYRNWNSLVRRLLDLVPNGEVLEWKLCDHASLATWIEGKVALIGDAAHPMLPYVAQGAAQAVEDGAVLSACLSMIDSKEEINVALKVYELVRKERAEIIHMTAAKTREVLHLPDGEKQRKRDHLLMNAGKGDTSPDFWTDKSFQQWCWVNRRKFIYFIIAIIAHYRAPTSKNKQSRCGTIFWN